MKDPKFVAFSTQKGGAGKTTMTVLMASYLYYVKGLKILVVDCDYPQFSIEEMRKRDSTLLEINDSFRKAVMENRMRTGLVAVSRRTRTETVMKASSNKARNTVRL